MLSNLGVNYLAIIKQGFAKAQYVSLDLMQVQPFPGPECLPADSTN